MGEFRPLWALNAAGLAIAETPLSICVLRVRAPDAPLFEALGRALGCQWPSEPNTATGETPFVAWLGPAEWAIFAPAEQIASTITQTCSGRVHQLVDLSAGRRLWRVEGPQARAVVAMACSLDLHPRAFGPGRCAQSLFADIAALIISQDENRAFDIVADASFAGHLRAWFSDASREFQI
jgi:sarcosine oxidase subunit gamma